MKVVATIQVRMGSSRLPGKVMKEVLGKPILGYLVERVQRSTLVDEVVVATSINPENDVIEDYCKKNNVSCYRGSEDDVLGRVCEALKAFKADVAVEIFGDSPFSDPAIIDEMVQLYLDNVDKYDFVGNDLKTTYPPGTEVEVYSVDALKDSSRRIDDPAIREHGTLYIRQNPEIYRLYNVEAPPEYHFPEMEIELDTEEDFQVVKNIIEHLYRQNSEFSARDVIDYINSNPELMNINKDVHRRWKELRADEG